MADINEIAAEAVTNQLKGIRRELQLIRVALEQIAARLEAGIKAS